MEKVYTLHEVDVDVNHEILGVFKTEESLMEFAFQDISRGFLFGAKDLLDHYLYGWLNTVTFEFGNEAFRRNDDMSLGFEEVTENIISYLKDGKFLYLNVFENNLTS